MLNDPQGLFAVLSNYGPLGILIGWLVWKDIRSDKAKAEANVAQIKLKEQQLAYNRDRLDADKAMSAALAALTGAIQSRGR